MIWHHLIDDLKDVWFHLCCAAKTLGACLFGKISHDGLAVTWRGRSYRIKKLKL